MAEEGFEAEPMPQTWWREEELLMQTQRSQCGCALDEQHVVVLHILGSLKWAARDMGIHWLADVQLAIRSLAKQKKYFRSVRLGKKFVEGMRAIREFPLEHFLKRFAAGEFDDEIDATVHPSTTGKSWSLVKQALSLALDAQNAAALA